MKRTSIQKAKLETIVELEVIGCDFRLDTTDGPIYTENAEVAIALYEFSSEVYALLANDLHVYSMICSKQVPFPSDVEHLYSTRILLEQVMEAFYAGCAEWCVTETLRNSTEFSQYYIHVPELMDSNRLTLVRTIQQIQNASFAGKHRDASHFSGQAIEKIGEMIDSYVIMDSEPDQPILKPEWRILTNSINS